MYRMRVNLNDLYHEIREILYSAGEQALGMRDGGTVRMMKEGRDFATDVDIALQKYLVENLGSLFPDLPVLGEEDVCHEVMSFSDFLLIDPIDGTFNFEAGGDEWGILFARISSGQPSHAYAYQPDKKRLLYAENGKGVYWNDQKLEGGYARSLCDSFVGVVQGSWSDEKTLVDINMPLARKALVNLMPSSSVEATFLLAKKVMGAYVNTAGKIWDFAVPALVVAELGGVVTKLDGKPIPWNLIQSPAIFSLSKELHQEILSEIKI
jgi:myo-inositol-1(or 4)-monophosphatase